MLCELQISESKNRNEEVVNVASVDYQETPEDKLPTLNLGTTKDPYFQSERRKWIDGDDTGHVFNGTFDLNEAFSNFSYSFL